MASSDNSTLEAEAVGAVSGYLEKGVGKAVSVQRYNDTAANYDQHAITLNYEGPSQLGKTMTELYPSNRDVIKILDVAAGTGLSGLKMWESGFRQMDAVDPSQGMLDVAREKNVYNRFVCDFVDDVHQLDIEDNTYDAATICGGMGENQLPSGAFGEIIRVVKPGGLVVNVTRVEHYSLVDDYRTNLTPYFQKLEADGKWKEESKTTFPNFVMGREGIITIHRVLA